MYAAAKGNGVRGACPFVEIVPWLRRTPHEASVQFVEIVPMLRGTALATLVPFAGTAPYEFATDGLGARGLVTEAICAALLDRLATGARVSCETYGGVSDSAVDGRVGSTAPPSSCQFPVRKVLDWCAFKVPLGLWQAPGRIPGAAAGSEATGEGGTPPWWPDVYGLPV